MKFFILYVARVTFITGQRSPLFTLIVTLTPAVAAGGYKTTFTIS